MWFGKIRWESVELPNSHHRISRRRPNLREIARDFAATRKLVDKQEVAAYALE